MKYCIMSMFIFNSIVNSMQTEKIIIVKPHEHANISPIRFITLTVATKDKQTDHSLYSEKKFRSAIRIPLNTRTYISDITLEYKLFIPLKFVAKSLIPLSKDTTAIVFSFGDTIVTMIQRDAKNMTIATDSLLKHNEEISPPVDTTWLQKFINSLKI